MSPFFGGRENGDIVTNVFRQAQQPSTKELSKLEVIQKLSEKRMTQKEAGEMLHLGTRQIKRLLKRYRKQGASTAEKDVEFAKGKISRVWSNADARKISRKGKT